ncbi:MAG TPA: HD domain-containing protein [Candidatus Woesebacteria bacterium]|nr:HD domain-containing protein [Candidatus Woesebacteria bacterium]
MNDIKKIIDFLRLIEKLKTIERFNKTSNLHRAESDAEHIWHLVMMAYLMSKLKPELNKMKLIELSLVHDLVEVYAGDVNLWDEKKKTKEEKRKAEEKSAEKLFSALPIDESLRMMSLWKEYEERSTPESRYIYALDKLQPFLQRLVSGDNGWKDKLVDENKLKDVKPEEIKQDEVLSDIWDNFTNEAISRKMLYHD